jgi:hypothetical protein
MQGPTAGPTAPPAGPKAPPADRTDAPRAPARPAPVPSDGTDGAELHAALTRKIGELQRERQGRWQKLLGLVLGR